VGWLLAKFRPFAPFDTKCPWKRKRLYEKMSQIYILRRTRLCIGYFYIEKNSNKCVLFWALYFNTRIYLYIHINKSYSYSNSCMHLPVWISNSASVLQEHTSRNPYNRWIRIYFKLKFWSVIVEKAQPLLGLNWGFPYPHIVLVRMGLITVFISVSSLWLKWCAS
jgi:hypothetical protein